MLNSNKQQLFVVVYTALLLVYWVILSLLGLQTSIWNYSFSLLFSLTPLFGGIYGLKLAQEWGGYKSQIGKSILLLGLGLFTWGAGSMVWAYYNIFLQKEIPYPSEADVGYVLSIPLWLFSLHYLSKAIGTKFGLKSISRKLTVLGLALVVTIASYFLIVQVAREGIITDVSGEAYTIFFDLAYPLGDIVILVAAFSYFGLSYNYLGGMYRQVVYSIFAGFFLMYLADFIFSYTTTKETFYVGHWGDIFFMFAMAFLTYGLLGFKQASKEQR